MHLVESLYIHFPFCKHLCNYCDFYKAIPQDFGQDIALFHSQFESEWKKHESFFEENHAKFKKLKTLYLGGGTPSLWKEDGALFLKSFLQKNHFAFENDYEFTMEVNPATWTGEGIASWLETGVNRFSVGVQSYRDDYLKLLDRVHDLNEVDKTLHFFRDLKQNYSLDLMLGLPYSQEIGRDVIEELKVMLDYNPSHFSVYILTVKNHYKHFKALPDEDYVEAEYLKVSEFLRAQGFKHYEVSNFALAGKESKHNLQYWRAASVAALGPSATGFLNQNSQALRYKWKTTQNEFELERLSEKELKFEALYLSLRTNEGLNWPELSAPDQNIAKVWISEGKAELVQDRLILTPRGYLLLDALFLQLKQNG